jgi:hypothetical protein
MTIKMELKRPLVYKFIVFVLHGLDPITCYLDLNGFGWPLHGFGVPGQGFYSMSMIRGWIEMPRARLINLRARGVGQISHPRMLFGNPEKLARPKTKLKRFFGAPA